MKAPTDALLQVERSLAAERGPFALFALLLREEAPDKWDLVVSAPWIEENKGAALKLLSERVKNALAVSDLPGISRIVVADPSDPAVDAINRAIKVEHAAVEVKDSTFFGLQIKHGHIFASSRPTAHARQPIPNYAVQRTRRKRGRR
ncbi:MAG TPA: hypothetical protein VIV54_24565 [Burkholderiales bacterium]